MKRTFALPALALGAVLSLGACAQDGVTAPMSAPNAPGLARSGDQATVGNLIAALNNVAVNIDELNVLNDLTVTDVQVVNVENVLNNARILENARFLNNIGILQNFLNNVLNDATVEILNDALNNVDIDLDIRDVVAIDVLNGDLILFVQ